MMVTVSVKGQMVIPTAIRKKYNIQPQNKLEVIDKGREIVIVPLPKNPILGSRGILKGVTTKDLVKVRRQERKQQQKKYGISS